MNILLVIIYSLYFGLLPFDNLKDLNGSTITKTIGIILLMFLIIKYILMKPKTINLNFFNKYVVLIFFLYSISYFIFFNSNDSLYIRFSFLFLIFFFTSQLKLDNELIYKIFNFSTMILVIISTISIFLNIGLKYIDRTHYFIWNNMSVDANIFCSTLIFPFLYSIERLYKSKSRERIFCIIAILSIILSIFLSGSRGGILAVATGSLFLILFINQKNKLKSILTIICVLLIIIILVLPYLPTNILSRLSIASVINDKASNRFLIWNYALNMYSKSNIINVIFGYGFLSFKMLSNLNAVSHNLFLQTLIEGGLVMSFVLITFFYKIILYFKSKNDNFIIAYVISIIVMSCSIDVIISRFLWNAFMIISFHILLLYNKKIERMTGVLDHDEK